MVIGVLCSVAAVAVAILFLTGAFGGRKYLVLGRGELVVGKDIPLEDITEFYYTYDSSANPPEFYRYHFYVEEGKTFFHHERREGNHWPLTEADVTASGTRELTQEERTTLFTVLKDGIVTRREEHTDSGDAGPWLFLYWKGDRSKYQVFQFASWDTRVAFETFCVDLKER